MNSLFGKYPKDMITHKDTHEAVKQLRLEISELTKTVNKLTQQLLKIYSEPNVLKPSSLDREPTRTRSNSFGNRTFNVIENEQDLLLPSTSEFIIIPLEDEQYEDDFEEEDTLTVQDNTLTVQDDEETDYQDAVESHTPPTTGENPATGEPKSRSRHSSLSSLSTDGSKVGTSSRSRNASTKRDIPDADTTARKIGRFIGGFFFGLGSVISGAFAGMAVGAQSMYTRLTTTPDLGENAFSEPFEKSKESFDQLHRTCANQSINTSANEVKTILTDIERRKEDLTNGVIEMSEATRTPLICKQINEVKSMITSLASLQKQVKEWAVRVEVSDMIDNTNVYLDHVSKDYANGKCILEEYTRGISAVLFAIQEEIEHEPAYKKALRDTHVAKSLLELKTRAEALRDDVQKNLSTLIQNAQKKHLDQLNVFDSQFTKYIKCGHAVSATVSPRNKNATQEDLQNAMSKNVEAMTDLTDSASKIDKDHRISKRTVHPTMESAPFVHERNKLRLEGRTTLYTEVDSLVSALSEVEKTRNGAKSVYKKAIVEHEKNLKEIKTLTGRIKKVEDRKFKEFAKLDAYSQCARGTLARVGSFIYSCFASYRSQLEAAKEQHDLANQKAFNFYKDNVKEIENAQIHISKHFDLINAAEKTGSDSYKESAVLRTFKRLEDEERRLQKEVDRLESIIARQNEKANLEAAPLYAPSPKKSFFARMNPWTKDAIDSEDMDLIDKDFINPMHQTLEPDDLLNTMNFGSLEEFGLKNGSDGGRLSFSDSSEEGFAQVHPFDGESVSGSIEGSQYDDSWSDNEEIVVDSVNDPMEFNPFIKK